MCKKRASVLYCLIREDVPDMVPGKAAAQAMHAQSMISENYHALMGEMKSPVHRDGEVAKMNFMEAYGEWLRQANNFGTTIVLRATWEHASIVLGRPEYETAVVVDPTYPFRNAEGKVFTMTLPTCYAIFAYEGTDEDTVKALSELQLY